MSYCNTLTLLLFIMKRDDTLPCPTKCHLIIGYLFQACYRCHRECSVCSGGDISFCSPSSCVNYVEGKRCVFSCSSDHYGDAENRKCFQCDKQCLRCNGPTSSDCVSCRDLKLYKDIKHRDVDPSVSSADSIFIYTFILVLPLD